jgi:hypothetical protein
MRRRKSNGNGHLPAIPEEAPASLMSRDPALYEKIVDALEREGWSPGAISALYGVSAGTVRKIRTLLGPGACHAAIRHIASNMTESVRLLSARLLRDYDQIPASQMASSLGVLVDKLLLLTGGVTARVEVEHTKNVVSPEDLRKMFERLPKADAREVEAREITHSQPRH